MADNDTDALLKDLESRASSSPKKSAGADEGDEDIEAFLKSLEGDDYSAPEPEAKPAQKPVKTKTADPLEAQFAGLEEAPDAPIAKAPKKSKEKRKKKEKPKKEAKSASTEIAVTGEKSDKPAIAIRLLKWVVVLLPLASAWWILGAYLSNWVSAGWLVLILATVVVFALPIALKIGLKRGRFVWWTALTSTLLTLGLVAPLTSPAAEALAHYGHWPTTTLGQVAGLKADSPLVKASAAIGGWLGGIIHPTQDERVAWELGGDEPLLKSEEPPTPPTDPNAVTPQPTTPQPAPPQPPPTTPQPATPQPATPQPQPTTPQPQPTTPQPQPTTPQPQPATPQPPPTTPQPTAPQPTTPQPTTGDPVPTPPPSAP